MLKIWKGVALTYRIGNMSCLYLKKKQPVIPLKEKSIFTAVTMLKM